MGWTDISAACRRFVSVLALISRLSGSAGLSNRSIIRVPRGRCNAVMSATGAMWDAALAQRIKAAIGA